MTIDERIGRNVHELLWRGRLRQQPLFEAMGVSRFTLAKKLRGQIAWSAGDVQAAAGVLGVDPGTLFEVGWAPGDSNPQPTDWVFSGLWALAA